MKVTPPLFPTLVALYVSTAAEWKAYPLVPCTFLLLVAWGIHGARIIWSKDWFKKALQWPIHLVKGTLIPWLWEKIGLLRESAVGNLFLCFSALNLFFPFYWIYWNLDIKEFFIRCIDLLTAYWFYIWHPKEVLKEFDRLLQVMRLHDLLNIIHNHYIIPELKNLKQGSFMALLVPIVISFVLFEIAYVIYGIQWEMIPDKMKNLYEGLKNSNSSSSSSSSNKSSRQQTRKESDENEEDERKRYKRVK